MNPFLFRSVATVFSIAVVIWVAFSAPAAADAWPINRIGSGIGVSAKPERTGLRQLEHIKAVGFSYVRYDMRWSEVEQRKGQYNWFAFDRFIRDIREAGLKSIVILDGANVFYSRKVAMPPEENYGEAWSYSGPDNEESVTAFVAFAKAAVERYGANDIIWEIWNEPDVKAFWPPEPDPVAFSTAAVAICRGIREIAPNAKIIGPAIARLPDQNDYFFRRGFFKTFMESSITSCLTAISIHPYRYKDQVPETVIQDYANKVRPAIAAYTPKGQTPLPIVVSEWGYTTTEVSPEQQADYAFRMHLANLIAGVPISILYEWQDSTNMSDEREAHFGLIDSDGDNKGGADQIEAILPLVKDAVIVRRLAVNNSDCYALVLRQPDRRYQLLVWMGLNVLEKPLWLHIKAGKGTLSTTTPLSLTPQLIDIGTPTPEMTLVAAPPSEP